ncbi:unnamed protein product [Nippostrongylus brasiliensis]|uniref:Acetylcholine receptor subunit alpha-type acr-16 (inferred by orthology to a C. elegans protein) n=1 Tax=Nippostrongylus brasiliensis TaxID=27835 RepID=A0A0N4YDN2_NIPBR|nr:unnamed protein product [Nippostrongylus brasiliensis]
MERWLLVCTAMTITGIGWASYDERRLYEDLMRDYNSLERPVANHSKPVTVYLKVSLQQIIDVDEKNQIVYVNACVDANFDSTYPTNMVVYNSGDVHWIPPGIFKISCKIDIEWFPFDEQRCKFKPAKKGFDISEYLPNGEWALPLTTVSRNVKFYDCCPEPYPDLTFYLHMRRRTLYYGFNLIMPCILTTLMTLLGFTLPPDAGEKITLQITVLLSICFFLSIVSDMSPPTSEAVPLLDSNNSHKLSLQMRSVLLYWLPWLLRMKRPGVELSYATLPSLFNAKLKSHSESLIRNIKENESNTSRSNSLEIERRVHQYMSYAGVMNGVSPPLTVPHSQISAPLDLGQQATLLILQRIYHELKVG